MNTIKHISDGIESLSLKAKAAQAQGAANAGDVQDSPRAYTHGPKPRKLVKAKLESVKDSVSTQRPSSIRTTLKAQHEAGKTDSAREMYAGVVSPRPTSPKSPASPKSPVAAARSPKSLGEASLSEDMDALDFSSGDEATLNTGWNEWGIDADSDDESAKPAARSGARIDPKTGEKADAAHLSKSPENRWWDDWALSDDEA